MATKEKERLLPPSSSIYAIQPDDLGRVVTKSIKDTRLTTVTYSSAIVLMGSLLFGFAIGYSSPVISDLEHDPTNTTPAGYLREKEYQGVFSVSKGVWVCVCVCLGVCGCVKTFCTYACVLCIAIDAL